MQIVGDGRESSADRLFAASSGVSVGSVDDVHSGGNRLVNEADVLGRLREPVRPEADPAHLGLAKLQLRRRGHGSIVSSGAADLGGRR